MSEDKTPSPNKRSFLDHLGSALAGALIASAVWALSGLGAPVWAAIVREAPPQWFPRVIVLLVLLLLLLLAWALRLRRLTKEPSIRGLRFSAFGGFYVEPKTGLGVCTRCINDSPRRYVHLMDAGGGRICNACQAAYRNEQAPPSS